MDSGDIRDSKGFRRIKISVGLAALAVIVLILLLALTVRHAREKEMVHQLGLQQVAIARETAARLEDLIISVERSLLTLAAHPDRFRGEVQKLRAAHTGMEGRVSFMALTDERGAVLIRYPPSVIGRYGGFEDVLFFRQAQKTKKLAVSVVLLPGDQGVNNRSIAIGVPRYRSEGEFAGVALAVLPLTTFIDDASPSVGENRRTWLVDGEGTVLFHPNDAATGGDVGALEVPSGPTSALREALLEGTDGYGVYPLRGGKGPPELNIVAYAPIRLASGAWAVAVVTPYDVAIALFRKTFVNIMFGAAGLILAIIIAAWVIIYAGGRMLHNRAVEESLREREQWQEKLLREKRTVEGIIEGSPIPTFVLNRDHRIILWNRACMELTGFTAEEMIGTENQFIPFYNEKRPVIADLILEKDFESIEKYYGTKKVKKSSMVEGAYEARDFYRNLGGKNRHLYFLAAPIYDEKGGIVAAIETIQDTSKEEEMARELREYAETLRGKLQENIHLREEIESLYNHLQSIVDSLPERLFVLDSDGTIHYMSRGVKNGIGGIPQPFGGGHFLELVAPEQREYVMARWEEAKRGVFMPYEIEVKVRDGSDRTLLISGAAIRGTNRYVVVQQDISELKRLEEKISENEKMAALGQLSAGIAHEVRNPLSSIKMSLQILEKRMHPTGNDLKRFQIARREVEHLEKLVNNVLIFAKPAPLHREMTALRDVIEQALALAEKGIADKRIRVQTRFDEAMPALKLDGAMLEQAFLNLILNAVDAMNDEGLLRVTVRGLSGPEGSGVEVEIEDNGCGIDGQDMQHLFNPFFTRKMSGTGLGLTQVKTIVEMHQGHVDVFSRKGEGTRVRIRFPSQSGSPTPQAPAAGREAS
jgi:PAS domain S-box-containing protein